MLQCEAFAQLGLDTLLFAQEGRELGRVESHHAFYGVAPSFGLELRRRRRRISLKFAVQARHVVRGRGTDLLYGRDLLAVFLAARLGQPTVFETHVPMRRTSQHLLFRRLLRQRNVVRVVVISERLRELILEAHHPHLREDRLLVAHDGVDLGRLASTCRSHKESVLPRGTRSFVAGYFGHLYQGRGMDLLLQLADELPDITMLIVGGDPADVARLRSRARSHRNVFVTGFVPRGELAPYWAACDVLLMPYQESVGLRDGGNTAAWMSPLKMFEYMALGKPIISSDLPVLREVLCDHQNALLVPPDALGGWAAAVCRIRQDPALADRLGRRARVDVEAYSWRTRAQRVTAGILRDELI